MSDISLVFIAIGGITFLKNAWDYRHRRIPDRNVEVNRLKDIDVFCNYASQYSLINAVIVFGLFGIVMSERFFEMQFHFTWYFALLGVFLYRIFKFPRSFDKFYQPITMDTKIAFEEVLDEEQVDE